MYTASEEEVEEALRDDETISTSSSLSYLTESDEDDTSPWISTGSPALFHIPPLPPVSNNVANLPFMQTFIANIFIFLKYVFQHQLCYSSLYCRSYRHYQLCSLVPPTPFPAYYGRIVDYC